jgi:hypothetical protein
VVCVAHLLYLQVYAGSFETSQQGEMECCFSQSRHFLGTGFSAAVPREAFHRVGVQDVTEFDSC